MGTRPGSRRDSRLANPSRSIHLDRESGEIRFGDGARGKRPPAGATLRAEYDYGVGLAGNVGAGSINAGPTLPAGFKVTNPVRTWGGAEAESIAEGEKQIARYLQHRERLVTKEDFKAVTMRTPSWTSRASRCCPPTTRGSRRTSRATRRAR